MKALCQLILGVVIASTLHAQTLSFDDATLVREDTFLELTGSADAYEIIAYGWIFNNSNDSIEVAWARVTEDFPNMWEGSLVCDNNGCYNEGISSNPVNAPVKIYANESSNLDVHFKPSDVSGNGTVLMRAWVIGDSANTVISGIYKVTAQHPVGLDKVETENLLIYPNPAKDFVMIKNLPANEVSTVEVYNIFGRKLLAFSQPPSANEAVAHKFDLTALAKGIYMIRVFDGDMNVIYTKSLSKE